ncbi:MULTISPECIES: tetratricopeptide repeat protein [unclassified Imperialibacter]|uniref:tetratricopeptide repeat protein n=1 Tax=unclassified Imperialibacter TaxID=2629706 RepID=UPI001256BFB2|nr:MULTISPECIES: tetratricopeptide repeat protein [unclassified Imperialibacter]CAD5273462.1 putative Tetratricopeptide repeat-containing protein [Imperialibacter sp. 75]CAD5273873.1 putative Tetratricopeptide repeat-containing protein [Imperialibacter sp. 89]VVT22886.1 putative Tetratricopeptide repeat-containing protein [Imperialibacter sp. EC-SDR9]
MLKLPGLLIFFIFIIGDAAASGNNVDSLKVVLLKTTDGKARIDLFTEIANQFRNKDGDSMRWYAEQALLLTNEKTSPIAIVKVLNLIGIYHFQTAAYDSAIYYFERGIPNAQLAGDTAQLASFLNNIGLCFTYKSAYDKAIDYHLQALAIREAANDPKVSSSYNNLGITYDRMNDLENAEKYQLKALALKRQEGQRLPLANSLLNLGIIKRKQEQYKEAIVYYEESLVIAREFDDKKKIANALNNIGSAYVSLKDFRKAATYFEQSIALKREIGDLQGLARSLGELAEIRAFYGDFARGRALLLEAEAIVANLGSKEIEHLTYANRADIEEMAGNYKSALEFERKASDVWREMVSEEKNEKIAELEVAFNTAQKEAKIDKLSLLNKINEAEAANERAWFIASVVSLSMLVIGLMIFAVMQGKRRKVEMTLQEHQFDALQKRYVDLLEGPMATELAVDFASINDKLVDPLTEREFEAFTLSLAGKTNQEIGNNLFISINTVKFHLRNVYVKLGVSNRKEAVEYVVSSS